MDIEAGYKTQSGFYEVLLGWKFSNWALMIFCMERSPLTFGPRGRTLDDHGPKSDDERFCGVKSSLSTICPGFKCVASLWPCKSEAEKEKCLFPYWQR